MTLFGRIHRQPDPNPGDWGVQSAEPMAWLAAALGMASLVLATAALRLAPEDETLA